jgi:hypothetical protein
MSVTAAGYDSGMPSHSCATCKQQKAIVNILLENYVNGCSTAQHSTAQHSTAQHSTVQHSTAQCSTAQQVSSDKPEPGHTVGSSGRMYAEHGALGPGPQLTWPRGGCLLRIDLPALLYCTRDCAGWVDWPGSLPNLPAVNHNTSSTPYSVIASPHEPGKAVV